MKEFLGLDGFSRSPEGYMSWQHLTFVGSLIVLMIFLSILLGKRNRNKDDLTKNKVLIITAILINAVEIFKIICLCIRATNSGDSTIGGTILRTLPLFLCSIQLIAIPLAAFTKGRIKEASLDFVFIFGILGAIMGTIGAGQNYNAYPVLSLDNVASGITHTISGFTSLYIVISGMQSMKKNNILITFGILLTFCLLALIANITIPYNYMFLMNHDGTPYVIVYNLVGGNKILYPILVILLFLIYIVVFYYVYYLITNKLIKTKKV